MTSDQILAEIREANLSYLMLAQSLIRQDRDQALFRLGISEDNANLIATLTPAQSVAGLAQVGQDLTPAKTGRFFNHDGSEIAW